MSLTFRHLEIFRALMTAGTVTKAAELLYTSQPTVSRELARMEQILGFCLFERVNGRLKPSESAYVLFDEVKRSYLGLEHINSLVESLRENPSGKLSLICLPDFAQSLLPGACSRLEKKRLNISISISVQESPFLEQCLTSQQFDLGLTEGEIAPPGTTLRNLLNINEVCILPAGHPLLEKTIIDIHDFESMDCICFSANDPYRTRLDEEFNKMGVKYRQVIETPTAISLCSFVRKGMGIAIVNPLTALDYVGNTLHMRPLSFSCPYSISLVIPSYKSSNSFTNSFIEVLEIEIEGIKAQLDKYFRLQSTYLK
ncbi:LysR family transcriptional regulator [Vibrio salinus]|uniref:LysR family transcriptional regulator n=1 Tax=Vibrio salinus TaxID=2899784 RepID=UPI001E54B1F7|nr:LysR family transcriptional regulator [Vibrio salinus]MCE0495062.1 LysR family transcriptional regulator [Vibrio salinus]